MKKKKVVKTSDNREFDPDVLKMYLMGASNPGFSNKIESADELIDLHIEKHEEGNQKISPQDALFVQLQKFEYALDKAVAAGKLELRVVHGLGKGKLKEEIHKILRKHPHVWRFENDYNRRYGYGSTLILLK